MKKPKHKKTTAATLVLVTEQAMIGTLNQYALVRHELNRLTAAHEEAVAELQTAFDGDPNIVQLRGEMAVLESSVALFADNNRAQLFPEEKKSREYQVGTIGFRNDPPSVGSSSRRTRRARSAIASWRPSGARNSWSTSPRLQKAALLRERANLDEGQLKSVGLKFVQGGKFYIDLKSDAMERIAKPVEEVAA